MTGADLVASRDCTSARDAMPSRRGGSLLHGPLASIVWLLLSACSPGEVPVRFVPADADARARSYLTLFTEHRGAEAEARLHPLLAGAQSRWTYAYIDSLLGGQQLDSLHVVGSQVDIIDGVRHVNLAYEARPTMGRILASVATVDSAGTWFVVGLSARTIPAPVSELTAFTLAGRSPKHFAWLALTILCAAVSIGTAAWFATRRDMPGKWQWALFALVGVGAFRLDWSTGDSFRQLLHVQLLSAGAMRPGPFAPWVLTFAFPLGAILGLAFYRFWPAAVTSPPPTPWEPEPVPEPTATPPAESAGIEGLPGASPTPAAWNERVIVRLVAWVDALPPTLRPAAHGALLIVMFMLMRGAWLVAPLAIVAVLFTSRTPFATLGRGAMALLLALAGGALSGLSYGLAGRHIRRAFPGGRFLTGIVTIAPYMFVLVYIIRVADRKPVLAPWATQDFIVALVMTLIFGVAMGATWFGPEKSAG